MRKWRLVVAMLVLATGVSCSSAPKPIPIAGGAADLASLAGEWSGEYHAQGTGRQGSITFNLSAGADSALGEVLMYPLGPTRPTPSEAHRESAPTQVPSALSISFVRTAAGRITGRLDPYEDPECGCLVNTVFDGRIEGDVITGTYVAQRTGASAMSGEWKVTRKK